MSKCNENTVGYIYILTNPSFPQYVKIGYADDYKKRLKDLNRSECIPYAFRVYAVYKVCERLQDTAIHNMIDRINPSLRTIETFDGKQRKKEFYEMHADDAYAVFQTIAALSGTSERLQLITPEGHELVDEKHAKEVENKAVYTEEQSLSSADEGVRILFQKLKDALMLLPNVKVEPKKLYIAFKAHKNFIDVEVQRHVLKIFINLKKGELDDPDGLCDDVSNIGHWGNGDYRVYLKDESDLQLVLPLIQQSYKKNSGKHKPRI